MPMQNKLCHFLAWQVKRQEAESEQSRDNFEEMAWKESLTVTLSGE